MLVFHSVSSFFFFNDTATTEIYTLSYTTLFRSPREPMQLVGDRHAPRLVTINTGVDLTEAMNRFARQRVRELEALNLSGFVFKSASPSCGIRQVPFFNTQGIETKEGVGLFARAFMA